MVAARVQVGHSQVSQQIVNTKGRWKHAHQTRHPTLEDPLDPGNMRRRQESSYNVLIQTNKKPKDFGDRETMGGALVTIVRMLATDPSIWSTFMVFGPIHKEYARDAEFPAQVIESILINHGSNQLTPETGDKQHRLHLHFLFTIQHYSEIHIDFKRVPFLVAEMFNKEMLKAGREDLGFKPGTKPMTTFCLIPEMGAQKFQILYNTKELQRNGGNPRNLGRTRPQKSAVCKNLKMPVGNKRQAYR